MGKSTVVLVLALRVFILLWKPFVFFGENHFPVLGDRPFQNHDFVKLLS